MTIKSYSSRTWFQDFYLILSWGFRWNGIDSPVLCFPQYKSIEVVLPGNLFAGSRSMVLTDRNYISFDIIMLHRL